jgi:hypothetical protein
MTHKEGDSTMRSWQLFLMLWLASALCSAATLTDAPGQKEAEHYNAVLQRDFDATQLVLESFGIRLRVATELKECKLGALADDVAPSSGEVADVVIKRFAKELDNDQIMFALLPAVWTAISFYQIGFQDTAAALHTLSGEQFCKKATERANDILRDRKAAKKE